MEIKSSTPETVNLKMGNTNKLHPAFCFRYMHRDFNFEKLDNVASKTFLDKIDGLSKVTWQDICQSNRYKKGTEKIRRDQINQQIDRNITPDREMIVFHVASLFRIIGCRDGKVFYVLFIDTKGEVYSH
jgi:hypothetical protein